MYRVIPLTQGYVAIISAKHFRRVNKLKWHVTFSKGTRKKPGQPYARATVKGQKVYLHRFVINAGEGSQVDHKNHQTLDCRDENIKETTHIENQANRRNVRKK